MCHTVVVDGTYVNLYIGGSLEQEYDILRIYRNALMFLLPGLLLLSSYCGFLLSRRAMSPVDRMTKAALGIGIGNLAERLPVPSTKDEVQQLAEAWNQLLARLESAVRRLSQFSADISHDLRTSITVMLATAQLALSQSRSEVEYREDLNRIASECRSATTLLDALLSIVRSNNFVHEMSLQRLDLAELGLQGCRRVEDLAEAKNILLDWELPPHQVMIEGDEVLIHRLLGILLENAIKYTPEHGEVHLRVDIVENEAQLIVCDTGIGISPDAKAQIFERFYQADMRERTTPVGSGLGLSIARWIVDAHRARISVKSEHSSGTSFIIHFSLVTDAQSVSQYEQVGIPQ
jgi:signal transduction histidine kinase